MSTPSAHPLAALEPRLRSLLPAMLYASAWVEPSSGTLIQVFDHLRTLRRMLQDYVPRFVTDSPRTPGLTRHDWQEGTLMFTDLAGFTSLMEANANAGKAGVGSRVRFEVGDIFKADIHAATVVTLYLLPDVNLRLRPKLLKDLKPGVRIVSHAFDMGDWKPDKQVIVDASQIYLWTIQ